MEILASTGVAFNDDAALKLFKKMDSEWKEDGIFQRERD